MDFTTREQLREAVESGQVSIEDAVAAWSSKDRGHDLVRYAGLVTSVGVYDPYNATPYESGRSDAMVGQVDQISMDDPEFSAEYRRGLAEGHALADVDEDRETYDGMTKAEHEKWLESLRDDAEHRYQAANATSEDAASWSDGDADTM